MIVDERMVTFIHSLETENSEILETIEKEALDTYVPIIRKEMQSFLKDQKADADIGGRNSSWIFRTFDE
jgi:hypothetical protein